MSNYRELLVWKKAMQLVTEIYKVTKSFPSEEKYGLISQMRRAAVSIPSNIAEGKGRSTDRDFRRFLPIARGSLCELETLIALSVELDFLATPNSDTFLESCSEIGKMINGFMNTLDA